MDLCSRYRGVQQEYRLLDGSDRAILKYTLPLAGQSDTSFISSSRIIELTQQKSWSTSSPSSRVLVLDSLLLTMRKRVMKPRI